MAAVRVVAFDCDGVLFETLEANRQYYDHILRQFGRPRMNAGQLEFSHTHTVDQVIEHLIPDPSVQTAAHAFRRSLDYGIFLKYLTIEPDLVALLDWMAGRFRRAIATNRTDTMGRLLQEFDLARRFEMVVTSRDVERPKPFPDPLLKILARFGAGPQQMLFVGDSVVDQQTADAAGVPFVAYRNPALSAVHHIRALGELKPLLEGGSDHAEMNRT
ncbi:MAG: HAD family hydrolase [Desulfobacterales bacterium]|nr:HAD family hydrolase [Desulfobacterales bacterium]